MTGVQRSRALIVLIIAVIAMAILPSLVKYLNVKHHRSIEGHRSPEFPLEADIRLAAAIALFLVCSVIILGRGQLDRNISGALILLLALLVPYIISPIPPGTQDIIKVALAATVIIAVWRIGAPVDVLKWVPITGSLIGIYSIIGEFIIPEYTNAARTTKALISNWELAGPFPGGNTSGLYYVLALALTPLIANPRWRVLHGSILCTAVVASASRTALVAAGILALWWLICCFRSMISIRLAGTALIGCCAAAVPMLPLLTSDQHAFTGRGYVWTAGLRAWQESPLVGLDVNFGGINSLTDSYINPAYWHFDHGHNLFVDTLIRSGIVGMCVLLLVLLAAIRSTRAFDDPRRQIAFFGYLIAFLVVSSTEATWMLIPNMQLFPVVGLVFSVVICSEACASGASS